VSLAAPIELTAPSAEAIVYRSKLPASTNAALAIADNTIIIPAGGPETKSKAAMIPQVVAYRSG
jgi:hypothetical protein